MPQRTRFTIQEIIEDLRMTSSTTRLPVKAKSLTLLELCQTINDLRHSSSRSTAQILTRRLYLHPLTISSNAKQHSSRIIANNLVEIEELNQTISEKKHSPIRHQPYRGLSILSSSFPLLTRSNTKLNTSIGTYDHENNNTEFETSTTTTFSSNPLILPAIHRNTTSLSSSSKYTAASTRSSFISVHQKPKSKSTTPRSERIDVWRHLAHTLERPVPKDPPTTPLDFLSDSLLQNVPQPSPHSIQKIHIYKRKPPRNSPIDESDDDHEEDSK